MAILNKATILSCADLKPEPLLVPEWGGEVLVRGLTAGERAAYEISFHKAVKAGQWCPKDFQAMLVCYGTTTETGERMFADSEVSELLKKSGNAIRRIADKVSELSGISSKSKDDAEGKSQGTPTPDSASNCA